MRRFPPAPISRAPLRVPREILDLLRHGASAPPPLSCMSAVEDEDDNRSGNVGSVYAAIARTATRSIALYFSRPVRLFRPSKVNGWQTLKNLATYHGRTLSPTYISWLVKQHGPSVLAKHFVPPMMVNIVLGSVLWTTYSEASDLLGTHIRSPVALAAASGALAGGAQALVAAPAENVRFVLEGTSTSTGWSDAWKEVFRGRNGTPQLSKREQLIEARQVRDWMQEVGGMAGRGWKGWKWGVSKDFCGFSAFFAIFELTRRAAVKTRAATEALIQQRVLGEGGGDKLHRHTPRVAHALTLVLGGAIAGLAYELSCRPWDAARKAVHVDRVVFLQRHSVPSILLHKVKEEGWAFFVKQPVQHVHDPNLPLIRRRLHSLLRTVGRVGPWGVGFLVWEAFGHEIS